MFPTGKKNGAGVVRGGTSIEERQSGKDPPLKSNIKQLARWGSCNTVLRTDYVGEAGYGLTRRSNKGVGNI